MSEKSSFVGTSINIQENPIHQYLYWLYWQAVVVLQRLTGEPVVPNYYPGSWDLFFGGCRDSSRFRLRLPWLKNLSLSSSPWPTPVTTSTSAWIPIMHATPSPTAASASPSTETGRSTTCTWGRRVGKVFPLNLRLLLLSNVPHLSTLGVFSFTGINTLINIMSRLGQDDPSPSR